MWGFIKTVNKLLTVVWAFCVKLLICKMLNICKYYIFIIVYLVKKSNTFYKKIENHNIFKEYIL